MGSVIDMVCHNRSMDIDKKEEFKERLKILFHAGGMMKCGSIELYGKKIYTLEPVDFDEDGDIDFTYNYFDESFWEDAGYDYMRNKVYAGKVGNFFGEVMCAAHVLETLYLGNDAIVLDNRRTILNKEKYFISWFNYLFHENFSIHHWDKWKAYFLLKDSEYLDMKYFDTEFEFNYGNYPMISNCEVLACVYGLDELNKELSLDKYKDLFFIKGIKNIKYQLEDFRKHAMLSIDEQIDMLVESMKQYIEDQYDLVNENSDNIYFRDINISLMIMDSPILEMIAISEVYNIDFWELYKRIGKYEERRFYSSDLLNKALLPTSTVCLFDLNCDDMIYYWRKEGDIHFSQKLIKWFNGLNNQYKNIVSQEINKDNFIRWFIDILNYAYENYNMVMPFAKSIYETFNHINDNRYLALWKIFEKICYEEESVFKRIKLKRYLALIANKELREMVFGF